MDKNKYEYVLTEETTFKTLRVPVTSNKDWNMHEHIERCTNVANGWFHRGKDDGTRPYTDIVSPIINVAFRSEGFDVKDIVPYVNDPDYYYKSFLVKKYHPQWARKNELDTFIDEMVESSVIYDLALIKNCNSERPEVVPLQEIAFCDQTNVLSGALCLKHYYSPAELEEYSGKWDADRVEEAIVMSEAAKKVSMANDQKAQTPGKYIEVYELHGNLPTAWLDNPPSDAGMYTPQMQIITYYKSEDGKKNGICLFNGVEKKSIFKAVVLRPIFGRACGRSIVESLFEDQVWTNYSGIRIKEMLDAAAVILFHSDDEDIAGQKLTKLKGNTVLKVGQGKSLNRTDTTTPQISEYTNDMDRRAANARLLGSASESALGINPSSGTPFKLQDLITTEGQGIHEYRRGKLATFMSDQLYRDWILNFLVKDMNGGKKFSEELSFDELQQVAEMVTMNEVERRIKRMILATGNVPSDAERDQMKEKFKAEFLKGGSRRFMEALQGELKNLPVDVYVNIANKQQDLAKRADKLTNLIMAVIKNPMAFKQIPGIGKLFNELVEDSNLSPVNFTDIVTPETPAPNAVVPENSIISPLPGADIPGSPLAKVTMKK